MTLPFTRFFTISDLLQALYPSLPEFIMSFPKYFTAFTKTDPAILSEELYRSLAATILPFPNYCAAIYRNWPFLFQGVLQFTASDLTFSKVL